MPSTEPALRKFGDNVRSRREAQDLSQEQLAERADLDRLGGPASLRAVSWSLNPRPAENVTYSLWCLS